MLLTQPQMPSLEWIMVSVETIRKHDITLITEEDIRTMPQGTLKLFLAGPMCVWTSASFACSLTERATKGRRHRLVRIHVLG
jgi:hypothetical protein